MRIARLPPTHPPTSRAKFVMKAGRVRQALVPASLLTSVLDGSLLAVDVRPLVIHALRGLCSAGIEHAVVVLGTGAEALCDTLRQEQFATMRVEFIWGVDMQWGSSLANNIMAARAAFASDQPLIIVRSDYLFDWRLLHKMANCVFDSSTEAFALIDSATETLEWVSGAHCKAYCKDGHCNGKLPLPPLPCLWQICCAHCATRTPADAQSVTPLTPVPVSQRWSRSYAAITTASPGLATGSLLTMRYRLASMLRVPPSSRSSRASSPPDSTVRSPTPCRPSPRWAASALSSVPSSAATPHGLGMSSCRPHSPPTPRAPGDSA